jgi:hypothetical protein
MFDPDRSTPWATNRGLKPALPLAWAFSRQPRYGLMVFFFRKRLARIRLTNDFIGVCRGDAIRTWNALEILKVRLADLVKADALFLATAITSEQMEKEPTAFACIEIQLAIAAGCLEAVPHCHSPSCSVAAETSCGPVSGPRLHAEGESRNQPLRWHAASERLPAFQGWPLSPSPSQLTIVMDRTSRSG